MVKTGPAIAYNILDAVWDAWLEARGNALLPRREALDLSRMKAALPHVVLTRVHRDPLDFEFRIIGEHIQERIRRNQTGTRLSTTSDSAHGSRLWSCYETAVRERAPFVATLPYVGRMERLKRTVEMYLPMADAEGTISHVLVAVLFIDDVLVPHL